MRQQHQHPFFSRFPIALRCTFALGAAFVLCPSPARAQAAAPTRTAVTATAQGAAGLAFTTSVRTTAGAPVSGGTIDFLLPDGQSLGSAPVGQDGAATLTVTEPPAATGHDASGAGELEVAAAYHAGARSGLFADSTSGFTRVALPLAGTQAPGFSVTANPTTITVAQGGYGTTALTVASQAGYSGAIELSCSNLPAQVTCAFNPTQQDLAANGSFVTTLELQTQAPSGTSSSALFPSDQVLLALLFPGGLVLLGLARRRPGRWLAVLLMAAGAAGLSGCSQRYGYLHHPPPVAGGTPGGTYSITVAVDGNQGSGVIENDIPISLVVQ